MFIQTNDHIARYLLVLPCLLGRLILEVEQSLLFSCPRFELGLPVENRTEAKPAGRINSSNGEVVRDFHS